MDTDTQDQQLHAQLHALVHVRAVIRDRRCWTQRAMARDASGAVVPVEDPYAVQFCLLGAVERVINSLINSPVPQSAVIRLLLDTLYELRPQTVPGRLGLLQFNDAATHEDVIGLLNRTILLFARRSLFARRIRPPV